VVALLERLHPRSRRAAGGVGAFGVGGLDREHRVDGPEHAWRIDGGPAGDAAAADAAEPHPDPAADAHAAGHPLPADAAARGAEHAGDPAAGPTDDADPTDSTDPTDAIGSDPGVRVVRTTI